MPVQAVTNLPWKDILKVLPAILTTATKVWDKLSSKPKPAVVDPNDDPKKQIATISERLQLLEDSGVVQADLIKQTLEQLQSVSVGLSETSKRSNVALWLGTSALIVSLVALVVVVFR